MIKRLLLFIIKLKTTINKGKPEEILWKSELFKDWDYILNVLYTNGFIIGYKEHTDKYVIQLNTYRGNLQVRNLEFVWRDYRMSVYTCKKYKKKMNSSILFIDTKRYGVLTLEDAIEKHVGGRLLFCIN